IEPPDVLAENSAPPLLYFPSNLDFEISRALEFSKLLFIPPPEVFNNTSAAKSEGSKTEILPPEVYNSTPSLFPLYFKSISPPLVPAITLPLLEFIWISPPEVFASTAPSIPFISISPPDVLRTELPTKLSISTSPPEVLADKLPSEFFSSISPPEVANDIFPLIRLISISPPDVFISKPNSDGTFTITIKSFDQLQLFQLLQLDFFRQ
ncbi:MAG: hypothetical protein PF445_10455, partial [Melioribacteraceae bacterium]|nr:hypothetical protein [Melioribacteraceae bacterium]